MLFHGTLNPLALRNRPSVDDHAEPAVFVATLTRAHNAQWEVGQVGTVAGAHLVRGHEMRLKQGTAEITFKDGAKVILRGPAQFRIDDADAARLTTGLLLAHVPSRAIGFHIDTPVASITDLGTEFGVDATSPVGVGVFVTAGRVAVQPAHEGAEQRIVRKGESIRITSARMESIEREKVEQTLAALGELRLTELHIATSFGTGADAQLQGGAAATTPFGRESSLWLKSSTPNYTRVALVRFDLTPVKSEIVEATLELTVDVADSKPSTRIEIANFPHGNWSESTVAWNHFAELKTGGEFRLPPNFARVGELEVPSGAREGTLLRVSDPRLTAFLNRQRGKRATLVLADTSHDVITRLAAKEHQTLAPPTLHLKLADASNHP
jgi:hypothetical protein